MYVAAVGTSNIQLERGGSASSTPSVVLEENNPGAEGGGVNGTGILIDPAPDGAPRITVVNNGTLPPPVVP
jgi:hypothetical protein